MEDIIIQPIIYHVHHRKIAKELSEDVIDYLSKTRYKKYYSSIASRYDVKDNILVNMVTIHDSSSNMEICDIYGLQFYDANIDKDKLLKSIATGIDPELKYKCGILVKTHNESIISKEKLESIVREISYDAILMGEDKRKYSSSMRINR